MRKSLNLHSCCSCPERSTVLGSIVDFLHQCRVRHMACQMLVYIKQRDIMLLLTMVPQQAQSLVEA